MKQNQNTPYWASLLAGLLLLSAGSLAPALFRDQEKIILFIIVAGSALTVTSLAGIVIRSRRKTIEEPDERDRKIEQAARSKSWILTFCLIIVLLFIDFVGILDLAVSDVLQAVFLMMGISAAGFMWWYTQGGALE